LKESFTSRFASNSSRSAPVAIPNSSNWPNQSVENYIRWHPHSLAASFLLPILTE
jgi:hypothetical protein